MDYLTRKLKINDWNDVTYLIHTKQEADDRELEYVYWKDAKRGDLAISDDNYVAECVQRKKYKDAEQVTMPYGRMWISDKAKLFVRTSPKYTGEYGQCGTLTWEERESRTTRTKNAVKLYVQMMMQTGKIDWTALGKVYRPDQFKPDATVSDYLKQNRLKEW